MPSFKAIVGTLFGLLITAISILGIVSYRYNEQVVNTSYWISHTHRVIEVADEISLALKDLQLESNAIYIRRDTSRLSRYRSVKRQVLLLLEEAGNLTNNNHEQRSEIDSLARLLPTMVSFADMAIPFSKGADDPQDIYKRFNEANAWRDRTSVILSKIRTSEVKMLRDREAENGKSTELFNKAFRQLLAGTALLVVTAFFSIRHNFNRLMRIDEQLRQAQENTEKSLAAEIELNKLKSNFVALASHEFRTPLTTILSSASLLENYASGENQAKASRHISRIKSSVNSLTTILNEFLSLTKIEEGRLVPNIERLDIKQYLVGCVANLQNFAKPGQRVIYTHSGLNDVETDAVFIGNIVNNLVSNAIKYSPENSIINVSSDIGDTVHLSVRDNGIGIPEKDQKHLFERFYRASNAGTVHGTGLGLHIMKHYVEMLNGTVQIKSELGKGTSVDIVLTPPKKAV